MVKPTESLPPDVIAAFERRQPIEAIKLLLASRADSASKGTPAASRPPVRTSKPKPPPLPSVESIASGRSLSPGEVPRASSSFWAWVVVALLLYLGFRLVQG